MRIRNLETFVKVAELESFHAAAKVLKATQPTVSSRVAALEADLGTSLFRRDQGGTTLTSRGRQLLPYAQRIVGIDAEMKIQLKQNLNEAGSVRIGIADTLAQLWVGPLLKAWRREFPHVEFEVVIDISDHLLQQISLHELDMVLMVAHPENEILLSEHLCSYPQVWMASNEYVQAKDLASEPLNLWQLSRCAVLSFPRNTQPWHYLDDLFSKMSGNRPMLHTCSSVSHLMNLTEQGLGISLLPEPLGIPLLKKNKLTILKTSDEVSVPNIDFCCGWRIDDERLLPKLLASAARKVIA
jgi:DNA-binding transcriptional LysR family regulator